MHVIERLRPLHDVAPLCAVVHMNVPVIPLHARPPFDGWQNVQTPSGPGPLGGFCCGVRARRGARDGDPVGPEGCSNVVRINRPEAFADAGERCGAAGGAAPAGGKSPKTGAPLCWVWNASTSDAAMKTSAIATASMRRHLGEERADMALKGFEGVGPGTSRKCGESVLSSRSRSRMRRSCSRPKGSGRRRIARRRTLHTSATH